MSSRASSSHVFGARRSPRRSEALARPTRSQRGARRLDCELLPHARPDARSSSSTTARDRRRARSPSDFAGCSSRGRACASTSCSRIRDDALARLDRFKSRIPNLFANYLRLDHLDRAPARAAIGSRSSSTTALVPGTSAVELEPALVEARPRPDRSPGGSSLGSGRTRRRRHDADGGPDRGAVPAARDAATLGARSARRARACCGCETLERLGGANEIVRTHLERALVGVADRGARTSAADVFNHLVTPSGTKIAHGARTTSRGYAARRTRTELEPVLTRLVRRADPAARRAANGSVRRRARAVRDLPRRPRPRRCSPGGRGTSPSGGCARARRVGPPASPRAGHPRVVVLALAAMTAIAAYAVAKRSEANKQAARRRARLCSRTSSGHRVGEKARAEAATAEAVREAKTLAKPRRKRSTKASKPRSRKPPQWKGKTKRRTSRRKRRVKRRRAQRRGQGRRKSSARTCFQRARTAVREHVSPCSFVSRSAQAQLRDPMEPCASRSRRCRSRHCPRPRSPQDGLLEQRVRRSSPARPSPRRPSARTAPGRNGVGERRSSRLPHEPGRAPPAFAARRSPDLDRVQPRRQPRRDRRHDGTVRIWDLAPRAKPPLRRSQPVLRHDQQVRSVEFSPDGGCSSPRATTAPFGVGRRQRRATEALRASAGGQVGALQPRRPADRHRARRPRSFRACLRRRTGAVAALSTPVQSRTPSSPRTTRGSCRRPSQHLRLARGTWRRLHLLVAHVSPVHGVSVSPDSTRAVSFDDSGIGRMCGSTPERSSRATSATRTRSTQPSSTLTAQPCLTASTDLTARIWTGLSASSRRRSSVTASRSRAPRSARTAADPDCERRRNGAALANVDGADAPGARLGEAHGRRDLHRHQRRRQPRGHRRCGRESAPLALARRSPPHDRPRRAGHGGGPHGGRHSPVERRGGRPGAALARAGRGRLASVAHGAADPGRGSLGRRTL